MTMYRNRQQLSRAQARTDYAAPMPDIDAIDGEPPCDECGTVEWSLWQKGGTEQDEIWECCNCGNRRVE